jgi:hypothetical protein
VTTTLEGVTHHLSHVLMLGVPFVTFVLVFAAQWRATAEEQLPAVLWLMAATTTVAGAVHAAVTPHHLHEAALLGWAMAVMCLAQLGWAVWLLLAPRTRVVEVGVLGNLGVVVLWAWTRLLGVPFGIAGGLRQRVGPWDLTCTLLEVAAVMAGLAWLSGFRPPLPHLGATRPTALSR